MSHDSLGHRGKPKGGETDRIAVTTLIKVKSR